MSLTTLLDAPRNEVSPLTKAQFNKLPIQHQRIIAILEQVAHKNGIGYSGTGKDRGINQLANRIGINNATLQTYLRGQSDPLGMRPRIFNEIAKARGITPGTLRALLEGRDEEDQDEDEVALRFLEYCNRVPINKIPEGIILLANRLQGIETGSIIPGEKIEEEEVAVHEGNLRLWELVEKKWADLEETLGYEPEQMEEEEFISIADRIMKGDAKVVFDLLRYSTSAIENKYLAGSIAKFLGLSSADLIKIRDGKISAGNNVKSEA